MGVRGGWRNIRDQLSLGDFFFFTLVVCSARNTEFGGDETRFSFDFPDVFELGAKYVKSSMWSGTCACGGVVLLRFFVGFIFVVNA